MLHELLILLPQIIVVVVVTITTIIVRSPTFSEIQCHYLHIDKGKAKYSVN
jgi:hypothetical protein